MKRLLLSALFIVGAFIACQKTINWDLGLDAIASIATDSSGNCLPIPVYGIYKAGSGLNDSNYIMVQVLVDSPGNYNMYTNVVNGYSFTASGTFTQKGFNPVKLIAAGTPVTAETDNFTVYLNSSACSFSVNVLNANADSTAVFELADSLGTCSNATINGAYTAGQVLTDSNTVVLQVNVIVPGVYNFTTELTNGMIFSSSGTFTTTGIQNVTLQGSGTPTLTTNTEVAVAVDTTNCSFVVPVK